MMGFSNKMRRISFHCDELRHHMHPPAEQNLFNRYIIRENDYFDLFARFFCCCWNTA